jgi:hypothetical protein
MREYDTWAPVYDSWASDMTGDVAHYVSLAREPFGDDSLELVYVTRKP